MEELKYETIKNRLINMLMLYNQYKDSDFPKSFVMLGFGNLNIQSKEELRIRIKELSEILKIDLERGEL